MTDIEFMKVREHVYQKWGIDLQGKKRLLEGRMENYLRTNGYSSCSEYMQDLEMDFTGNKTKDLIDLVTTNHTYFMREFEQMQYFKDIVLPQIVESNRSTHDLRLWCGAASTGEEPYMIAMLIKEFFGIEYGQWDTTLLATDISQTVLQTAIDGRYKREQLENIPESWKRSNFTQVDENVFEVAPQIKQAVLFRAFNLMDPLPFKQRLHAVFLRNVMIYFDTDTKRNLIKRIYDVMEPGGYLFIGATEAIDKDYTDFQYVKPSIFRK
ncbi:CheR family methyltransferase [Anaerosporobacter sp.]|uniref:CheR family methyltransferase n=1 Tax=Anaerosporobacter sp. TaxID=1872529 RepID=UPI00286EF035|nr:protein-glutamate O-methyltransferase CheR [Anaerosporobacter sp.]